VDFVKAEVEHRRGEVGVFLRVRGRGQVAKLLHPTHEFMISIH